MLRERENKVGLVKVEWSLVWRLKVQWVKSVRLFHMRNWALTWEILQILNLTTFIQRTILCAKNELSTLMSVVWSKDGEQKAEFILFMNNSLIFSDNFLIYHHNPMNGYLNRFAYIRGHRDCIIWLIMNGRKRVDRITCYQQVMVSDWFSFISKLICVIQK